MVSEATLLTYAMSDFKDTKLKNSCSSFVFSLLLIVFVSYRQSELKGKEHKTSLCLGPWWGSRGH